MPTVGASSPIGYRTAAPFRSVPGGWLTEETVTPVDVEAVGPLLERHRTAGNELRVVPDLWALWLDVIEKAGIVFSGIRLKNLPQHPETRSERVYLP